MTVNAGSSESPAIAGEALLELLADDYARRILQAAVGESVGAQQIAETTGISKPTVYRRLDRLERAGLVTSELLMASDGNHYNQYRTVLERMSIQFGDGEPTISVRTDQHHACQEPTAGDGGDSLTAKR